MHYFKLYLNKNTIIVKMKFRLRIHNEKPFHTLSNSPISETNQNDSTYNVTLVVVNQKWKNKTKNDSAINVWLKVNRISL